MSVPERAPAGESAHAARSSPQISRGKQTPGGLTAVRAVWNFFGSRQPRRVLRVPGEARPDIHVPFPAAAFLALRAVAPGDCLSWSEHQLRSE